jgi:hypothetical protein
MKFILGLIIFFTISCSNDKDGPLSAIPKSAQGILGEGFFQQALIDSGRIYHALEDTIAIELKRVFELSDCSLQSIVPSAELKGDHLVFSFEVILSLPNQADCATSLNTDTTLYFEWLTPWSGVRKILVTGLGPNPAWILLPDSLKTDSATLVLVPEYLEEIVHDTILVAKGFIQDSLFEITRDSNFIAGTSSQHRLFRRLYDYTPLTQFLKLKTLDCTEDSRFNCEAEAVWSDTIITARSPLNFDTLYGVIEPSCPLAPSATIKQLYCSETQVVDSVVLDWADTIKYFQHLFFEKISDCSTYNLWSIQNSSDLERYALPIRLYRELFHFNEDPILNCNPEDSSWVIYNLNRDSVFSASSDSLYDFYSADFVRRNVALP